MQERFCNNEDEAVLVLHRGQLAKQVLFYPRIETFTIARGWTQQVIDAFREAIHVVIQANPILSGHLYQDRMRGLLVRYPKVYTRGDEYNNDKYVTVQDLSKEDSAMPPVNELNEHDLYPFWEAHILPRFQAKPPKSVREEISKRTHLFEASLLLLPGDRVCYRVGLSHALGDVATYYLLVQQISCALHKRWDDALAIHWGTNPKLSTHELAPPSYTRHDVWATHDWPIVVGAIASLIATSSRRRTEVVMLSREKIKKKKEELLNRGENSFLSSHDIILAALCQCNKNPHLMSFNKDERERDPSIDLQDGGNFVSLHFFPRALGEDPNKIRQLVDSTTSFYGVANNIRVPLGSVLSGKFCVTSSWTKKTKLIEGKGIVNIGHFPSPRFFSPAVLPFDVAVIFSMNKNCIGLAHNFLPRKKRYRAHAERCILDEILYTSVSDTARGIKEEKNSSGSFEEEELLYQGRKQEFKKQAWILLYLLMIGCFVLGYSKKKNSAFIAGFLRITSFISPYTNVTKTFCETQEAYFSSQKNRRLGREAKDAWLRKELRMKAKYSACVHPHFQA